ncbi:hypothetical protein [Actinoplanes sp. GCM10030250]|uniref:hypothetical protein n=1 Tax=Actinoplanes sp. GCM10030250 TaxID=3273376 RepID=UPI00361D8F79
MVHAAAVRLGRDRGWDQDALAAAHGHALAAGLRYRWTGPSKISPDRRHVACPVFVLHDDGFGRVMIEVRQRDHDRVIAVSEPALAFSTSDGFQRSARTLRWQNKNSVGLIPWSGLFGDQQGMLRLNLAYPGEPRTAEPPPPQTKPLSVASLPQIIVQVPAEIGPRITVVGGGPMNGIPAAYEKTLDDLLDRLQSEPWQVWWAAEAEDDLKIWYDFAVTKTGIAIRHAHGRWRTTIRRPAATFAGAPEPATLARQDVDAMLAAIQRRTRLSEHPPL